jgi:transmembrane protein 231
MGIPIKAPIVHEDVAKTQYRANGCAAVILDIVSMLSVLLLPLLVGFSLGRFWETHSTFSTVATATYTGKAMARAVATDGSEYLWATSDRLRLALQADERSMRPFFSHLSDDRNRDGRPDTHTFSFQIPLRTSAPIARFELLPAFDYSFTTDVLDLAMESAPFVAVAADAPVAGSILVADGKLRFSQTRPLSASEWTRYDVVYKQSYLDDVRDQNDISNIAGYGRRYNGRNETTPVVDVVTFTTTDASTYGPSLIHGTTTDSGSLGTCGVEITIRVPPARVDYSPSFGESLKHGWVQYFCIAYIFHWAFGLIKGFAVSQAFVNTIAEVRGRP